jgi:iron complex outermembrane receptor protein
MHSKRAQSLRLASLSLAAAATTLAGQVAVAQGNEADALEEVVVTTARQRSEVLQDVPATITALTADTLEAASVERAGDFVRLTPGVTLVQSAEVADAQVNIRGINGARDAENSFALIIDGVLQTNPAAFNREYADLKQIEIVKGPQGAVYGRNAAAGAIIITTSMPRDSFGGDARVSYGEDATYTGSLVLSGPVSDRAGWKVAADYRSTDGFYRNSFLDRKAVDDFEGWNVNGRLVFEPTDGSRLDIKARYGESEGASISFNPNFLVPGLTFAPLPNAQLFNEDVNTHSFDFVPNIDPFNNQESAEVSIKWDQDLSFGKLTAWALYSDIQNEFGSDGTSATYQFFGTAPNALPQCLSSTAAVFNSGFALPAPQLLFGPFPNPAILGPYTPTQCDGTQYQVRNQTDYSVEVRLASDGEQRVRWQTGLYYLNIDREVGVNTGIDDVGRITPSLYVPAGQPNATEQLVWDNFKSDVYAVFGNVDFDITDDLEFSVAGRYDREERSVTNLVPTAARTRFFDFNPFDNAFVGNAPLNPALVPSLNPGLVGGRIPERERTFQQFQPKVSLTWKQTADRTWYANWGVGFKSGGFNNTGSAATVDLFINCFTGRGPGGALNSCSPSNPRPAYRSVVVKDDFEKEKSSAAEIGFKGNFLDRRLSVEASVFHTSVDDMQFFEFLVGTFGLLRVVNNIDEVTLKGAEIGLNAKLTDELRLVAGYSRIESKIDANSSRPASVGNRSPYTPDYTATAGVELDVPVGEGGWRMQGSAYWNVVGPTWFHVIQAQNNETVAFGTANFTNAQRDRFNTVDARVAVASDTWTFALVGKNVTNTKWLQEVIPAPEFGGAFIHPGTERRLSFEVGYKF